MKHAVCRLCSHAHSSREPHVLIGGPEPSKDVKRLARPGPRPPVGTVITLSEARASALALLERAEQERNAVQPSEVELAVAYDGIGPLSPENARLLTDRLKADFEELAGRADALARALELAQRREAWRALGYASWNEYVEAEFEISKRHANRLVSHQRFAAMLEGPRTSGPNTNGTLGPTLTERQTRAVRDDPVKIARVQRAVAQGVPPAEAVKRVLPPKATNRTPDPTTGAPCDHEPVTVVVCKNCGKRLE